MKRYYGIIILVAISILGFTLVIPLPADPSSAEPNRLCVVWSSADPDVAKNVCFMYTRAAQTSHWFDEVHLIVWGPSAQLLATNPEIQTSLKTLQEAGVVVEACVVCARQYGVADRLKQLQVDVRGMGQTLSDRLKSNWKTLTF